jgi:tripartite-type tricarboxylate transporter receptor subunit TctC
MERPVFRNASFLISLALSCVLASAIQAGAGDYPNRTITLIAPYAVGGGFDGVARIHAESMGRNLGQHIVVLNADGGGGTIGARQGAQAAPDGYTLLLHHRAMSLSACSSTRRRYWSAATTCRPTRFKS